MTTVRPIQPRAQTAPRVPSREMQELWFATLRHNWTSLAVIPADASCKARPIAESLSEVAALTGRPARVLYGEGLDLSKVASLAGELERNRGETTVWTSTHQRHISPALGQSVAEPSPAELILVALDPVAENPLLLPVVLGVSGVLLVVQLGKTSLEAARHTVELVGRDRIFGCVLVRS